jgi:AAA+ superfamily predicted ATPase
MAKAPDELLFHLRSLSRMVYFVTDEEDRLLIKLRDTLEAAASHAWVFNAALGLVPLHQLIKDWGSRAHAENRDCQGINDALIQIYKDDPKDEQNFYIITDPERWLTDPQIVRRILNIIHQGHNNNRILKLLIFVGTRKVIPEKLAQYIEVVQDPGLTPDEVVATVEEAFRHLKKTPPADSANLFKGFTSYQINSAIAQSIVKTRKDPVNPKRVDVSHISEFKRRQLKKTDLVQYIEADKFTFDQVGGNQRFKAWAQKTRHAWTADGRKFGLTPPKGVLCVGVWGAGKSLSTKALGSCWGLPVVGLEMGRLRSSGVGESEANVYRAIRVIENAAPCILWVDEAEKTLSGGQSSAQSDAGTTSRTIGILSTWLQETDLPVCFVMTANSLKTLPIEFVNRANERFFFDMPSEQDRIDIIKIHLRKNGQDPDNYNLALLSERAEGMVGREIEQAIKAALIETYDPSDPSVTALSEEVLVAELKGKPRILTTMGDEVREIMAWIGFDPERNEGVRARYASNPNRSTGALKLISGGK